MQWLQEAQFVLQLAHVGPLDRLTLATDCAAWLCDLVVVKDKHLQESVYFMCGRYGQAVYYFAVQDDSDAALLVSSHGTERL